MSAYITFKKVGQWKKNIILQTLVILHNYLLMEGGGSFITCLIAVEELSSRSKPLTWRVAGWNFRGGGGFTADYAHWTQSELLHGT